MAFLHVVCKRREHRITRLRAIYPQESASPVKGSSFYLPCLILLCVCPLYSQSPYNHGLLPYSDKSLWKSKTWSQWDIQPPAFPSRRSLLSPLILKELPVPSGRRRGGLVTLPSSSDSVRVGSVRHYASQDCPSWDEAVAAAVDGSGNVTSLAGARSCRMV